MTGRSAIAANGWTIRRYLTVDSTQTIASALIADGARHRTVVVADQQTKGYGRKGDTWMGVSGESLLMTLILRSTMHFAATQYAMIAALAVINAIAESAGQHAIVKWPNDVLLNDRKVAGVLGDATWRGGALEAVRIGVGINVGGDRAAFAARGLPDATSIAAEATKPIDRETVLSAFLSAFAAMEKAGHDRPHAIITSAWRAAVVTRGRRISARLMNDAIIGGVATDVTVDGDLLVIDDGGTEHVLTAPMVRTLRHVDTMNSTDG